MTRRTTLATIVIVLTALLLPGTSAAATRSCGTITVQRVVHARVGIEHGHVSCHEARSVMKAYGEGHGIRAGNRNGSRAEMYSILPGGWRCKSGAGSEACVRGKRVGFYYQEQVYDVFA